VVAMKTALEYVSASLKQYGAAASTKEGEGAKA
jgi:hypothetical protein